MRDKTFKMSQFTDLMVVQAVAAYQKEGMPFPYERLSAATGAPEKVTYRACERAYDHGLIEYGVSLRTGWLTEKGEALLINSCPL